MLNTPWPACSPAPFPYRAPQLLYQPMPTAYSRMTLRFLVVFITFLPLPFWDFFAWWALPVSGLLAFLLAGVENIGTLLEEPHRCAA